MMKSVQLEGRLWVRVLCCATLVLQASAGRRLPDPTVVVGQRVSGGPAVPAGVTRLSVPKDRPTFLSTVQSVLSFNQRPPSVPTSSSTAPPQQDLELVTARYTEDLLDTGAPPAGPPDSASGSTLFHAPVHELFGPEDAVTLPSPSDSPTVPSPNSPTIETHFAEPAGAAEESRRGTGASRRADDLFGASYRRVITPGTVLHLMPASGSLIRPTPRDPSDSDPAEELATERTVSVIQDQPPTNPTSVELQSDPWSAEINGLVREKSGEVTQPVTQAREETAQPVTQGPAETGQTGSPAVVHTTEGTDLGSVATEGSETMRTEEVSQPAAPVSDVLQCPLNHAFWEPTRQCVPIGEQGPCPEGRQVTVNGSEVACACRPSFLPWTDGSCYLRFTQGPCRGGVICESDAGPPECRCRSGFQRGRDGTCYREYSPADCPDNSLLIDHQCTARGPCPESFYMVYDVGEGRYRCGCPPGLLLVASVNRCLPVRTSCQHCTENLYRWPADGKYYQEFSQGPCNATDLFLLRAGTGSGSGAPVCGCLKYEPADPLAEFLEVTARWPLDGRCYRLHERAICEPGQWFVWDNSRDRLPVCCPVGHYYWSEDGRCYPEFTRGPCTKDKLFLNVLRNSVCTCGDQWGFTVLNPNDGTCYLRNTRGPCKQGFRFLGVSDESNQLICDCHPGEFYHRPTDRCYPLYTQGPCSRGEWLVFGSAEGRAVCRPSQCPLLQVEQPPGVPSLRLLQLPKQTRLVYWRPTDRCYQLDSQGPCSDGFTLQLDQYGISPVCQPALRPNRDEPVQAPMNDVHQCPPGSLRALSGLCLPVLVTTAGSDSNAICGQDQTWSAAETRCRLVEGREEMVHCPPTYYPYPEAGVCVCPRGMYPDPQGRCVASRHQGPGPLHRTVHTYRALVEQHRNTDTLPANS